MIEKARVLRVDEDRVVLACDDSACGACPASAAFCSPRQREFVAGNRQGFPVETDQMVNIHIPPGRAIWAGFTVLMLPLLMFVAGYFAGEALLQAGQIGAGLAGTTRDALSVLVGLLGLGLGFGGSYLYHRGRKAKGADLPQIVEVIRPGAAG